VMRVMLGVYIPVNPGLFNYFLKKYYSCPGVAVLKSLKVAVTNVQMDVNILFEKVVYSSCHQRRNNSLNTDKRINLIVAPCICVESFQFINQRMHI